MKTPCKENQKHSSTHGSLFTPGPVHASENGSLNFRSIRHPLFVRENIFCLWHSPFEYLKTTGSPPTDRYNPEQWLIWIEHLPFHWYLVHHWLSYCFFINFPRSREYLTVEKKWTIHHQTLRDRRAKAHQMIHSFPCYRSIRCFVNHTEFSKNVSVSKTTDILRDSDKPSEDWEYFLHLYNYQHRLCVFNSPSTSRDRIIHGVVLENPLWIVLDSNRERSRAVNSPWNSQDGDATVSWSRNLPTSLRRERRTSWY